MADDITTDRDPTSGLTDLVGLEFTAIEEGYSRGTVDVREELLNPHGVLHGAVAYTMADTGMGAALYPDLGGDEACATIEVKISYLEPITEGTVTCESRVVRRGGSVAHLESDVRNGGESVARATGSFSIFER